MNKQIRLLAEQAKLGSALLLHHWGTVDALTDYEQNELEQIEKFAELIIQECVSVLNKRFVGDLNREDMEVRRCIEDINKHFKDE